MAIVDVAKTDRPRFAGWGRFLAETTRGAVVAALVIAAVMALRGLEIERKCAGPFSLAFDSGFARYRCDLEVGYAGGKLKLTIPIS